MFPLSTVLFPHAPLPLHVFEPRYRALTAEVLAGDGRFGVVLIERGSEVGPGGGDRCRIGTVAHLEQAASLPDGRWVLVARGGRRFAVDGWLPDDPYPLATVCDLDEGPPPPPSVLAEARGAVLRARTLLSELGEAPALGPGAWDGAATDHEAGWRVCAEAPLSAFDRQRLLEEPDAAARLALVTELATELGDDAAAMLAGGGTAAG